MSMSMAMLRLRVAVLALPMLACTFVAFAAPETRSQLVRKGNRGDHAAALRQFEAKVRPLLEKHCIPCHGPSSAKAGLRLDSNEGYATPGIITPGNPKASLLIQRVLSSTNQMPPSGHLTGSEIDSLTQWVANGAVDPRQGKQQRSDSGKVPQLRARPFHLTPADRGWWAFQPVRPPKPGTSIDGLVSQRLAKSGLRMSPLATPRERIRRATFDILGIPPSPADVAAFCYIPLDLK